MSLNYVFTNISTQAEYDIGLIFKISLIGLKSEFSFSVYGYYTKIHELSLSYYLPTTTGRILRFRPFLWVLALCNMQTVKSRF